MKQKIGIVDVGIGNTAALLNSFRVLGHNAFLCKSAEEIDESVSLVLAGAGHYGSVMERLNASGFSSKFDEYSKSRKMLGICVGAQIMGRRSQESDAEGLKLLDFECVKFTPGPGFPVPNTGWRKVNSRISTDFGRMYFTHSYHFRTEREDQIVATAEYGIEYPALIGNGNVLAAQFHPEKSHKFGMAFLEYWLAL